MADDVQNLTSELEKIADDARMRFGSLTGPQLNWKPAPEKWSVGQCFDHLIKINSAYFPELERIIKGERRNRFWENYSPFSGFFGNLLLKSLSSQAERKLKAPKAAQPSASGVPPTIIEDFFKHQADLADKIRRTVNLDTKKIILTSPFIRIITYSLFDGYRIIVTHEKRHFEQAKRVTENEGFPS